jgi:hypothetical protein
MPYHLKRCQAKKELDSRSAMAGTKMGGYRDSSQMSRSGGRGNKNTKSSSGLGLAARNGSSGSRGGLSSSQNSKSSSSSSYGSDNYRSSASPRGNSNGGGAPLHQAAASMSIGNPAPDANGFVPCVVCGRSFSSDRVGIHQRICRKIVAKANARAPYDPVQARTGDLRRDEGSSSFPSKRSGGRAQSKQQEPAVRSRFAKPGPQRMLVTEPPAASASSNGKKMPDWKKKHLDFQNNIKEAKKIQRFLDNGGNVRDLPPMQQSNTPSHEEESFQSCPYCNRTFNPKAAERHIPKCKDMINRPKPPPMRRF